MKQYRSFEFLATGSGQYRQQFSIGWDYFYDLFDVENYGLATFYETNARFRLESIIYNLRKHIDSIDQKMNDAGTSDLITVIMITGEQMAWIL